MIISTETIIRRDGGTVLIRGDQRSSCIGGGNAGISTDPHY